ncbi:MAG TPA: amino acid ABC transporter permease [Marmoricola sp.]|nr:amino acid ABC transporter permease [Marmoricola sp.]
MSTWTPSARELERARIRRQDRFRRAVIATAVTVAVAVVLWYVITHSAGWPRVRETFLSGHAARQSFPAIAKGFGVNVAMFLVAEPLILLLGGAVALTRSTTSPWLAPARVVAVIYTDLLRGVPTLLVVVLFAFGIPALELTGITTSLFWLTLVALVLSYGAYVAEVIRAGIESIHPSQVASAEALALSRAQTMRFVVLPQAVRRVVPPLLNDFVSLQKDTALVSAVGVSEALLAAQDYGNFHFNYTPLLVTAAFFVALTIPLARFTDWLGRRAMRRERGR